MHFLRATGSVTERPQRREEREESREETIPFILFPSRNLRALRVFAVSALFGIGALGCSHQHQESRIASSPRGIATLDEVIKSNRDLWGEEALKQPGGP